MYENLSDKLGTDYKIITKAIFQGLTIAQMAQLLNCSQSTVSNRMNSLFEKYNAKTRFEFVLGVLGEIMRNNRAILDASSTKIEDLKAQIDDLTLILKNIILNKHDEEHFEYWIKEAQDKII